MVNMMVEIVFKIIAMVFYLIILPLMFAGIGADEERHPKLVAFSTIAVSLFFGALILAAYAAAVIWIWID